MLRLRRRSKKSNDTIVVKSDQPFKPESELERFLSSDKELFEALYHTMLLDPRKVETSMKDAAEKAKKFEKEKNLTRARIWYDIAGGLAIYEGNTKKVMEFFGESQRITGASYPILKNPEKAIAKAQEFYKKTLA